MNQQPDKLFRDKLYGHQRPVSSEAWQKVASNINRTAPRLWMKVAATVVVSLATGIFLYSVVTEDSSAVISQKEPAIRELRGADPGPKDTIKIAEGSPTEMKKISPPATVKEDAIAGRTKPGVYPKKKSAQTPEREVTEQMPVFSADESEPVTMAQTQDREPFLGERSDEEAQPSRKTVTIVFSAEEVNEKYLRKKNEAYATSGQKESSTLKNLLDKAIDLKHNQDPLGELRQKKDQILAMNFKKDKQRTEND